MYSPTYCTCCNTSGARTHGQGFRIRQVYDLPPIQIEVTEHKVEQKECPHCHAIQEAPFPFLQCLVLAIWPEYKRLIPYLTHYQCISLQRTKILSRDCFGHSISEGTLVNHTKTFAFQFDHFSKSKRKDPSVSCCPF